MGVFLEFIVAVVLGGSLLCMVEGQVHYYDFVLKDKNFTRLCETKSAMVVNESLPGPVVYVNKGDTIYVNVHNEGSSKVTIHWHGVKQPRNPWFDGPEYITQCPIQPGTNFTYEVIFTTEEGTLWWHAHNEWTRNTVHGAIVIYPEEGSSYPFPKPDAEEVLVLGSWYTYDVNLVVEEELTTGVELPISDSYTINSQPGDFCRCSKQSTYRWQVEYGKTYLLRIVNAIMTSQVFFAIAEHNLTIVGMDGAYLKPFVSTYITIAPGQTMDVIVITNQSLGQFYMAARQNTVRTIYTDYDSTNVTAILEYRGNYTPSTSPTFPTDTLPLYGDSHAGMSFRDKLKSLHEQNVPKNITTQMYITGAINELYLNTTGNFTASLAASLNNMTWMNRKTDVLQAYYYNMSGFYTEDFPDMPPQFYNYTGDDLPENLVQPTLGTKVKVLEYGEEVEMVFQSSNILNAAQDHPMHLHGHSFYVVGTGLGNFDFEEDPKSYNLVDPPYLNTATLPMNGWLAVRFRAINPGVWLWHCHLDHHLSYGMETVMIVKNGGTPETSMRQSPDYMPPCEDAPLIKLWKSK
ncbi:laccase-15 [Ricinus communis]|uniref:Laccase n=1 Tax=Ricinus communis TaxID=3988 RepID=B9SX35_RICCO|nr:laccase-15 [Ricinus communis]EEF31822.1 laccase, putative [Ricinus communis]|eukprot:XP_002530554.1 laccase-15 [Ricinus communis]